MEVYIIEVSVLSYDEVRPLDNVKKDLFWYGILCKCCIGDIKIVKISDTKWNITSLFHIKLNRYISGDEIDKYFKDIPIVNNNSNND